MNQQDLIHQLKMVTETVLSQLGITAEIQVKAKENGLWAEIVSPDSALLIGYRGSHLSSLEYLVRILLSHRLGPEESLPEIHLDSEGYRARQIEELSSLARRAAEQVLKTHQPEVLRPMTAGERRIVHLAIKELDGIATESIGADPSRRVVIKPSQSGK